MENSLYNTNFYQVSRTLLSIGLLFTFFFTDFNCLFITKTNGEHFNALINSNILLSNLNLFSLLNYHPIVSKIVSLLILVFVISGYLPQISGILHFWLTFSFLFASTLIDGGDQIHSNLSLMLLPICIGDNRFNAWKTSNIEQITLKKSNFFLFLIALQMSIVYFHASVGKFNVIEWSNGTAMYYWLNHTLFGYPKYLKDINVLFNNTFFTTISTYLVLIFELVLAGSIFMERTKRKFLFPFAIGFHLFISLLLGISSFFYSMAGGLVLFLLPVQNVKFDLVKKIFYKNKL